jgi:hypothetical protein
MFEPTEIRIEQRNGVVKAVLVVNEHSCDFAQE